MTSDIAVSLLGTGRPKVDNPQKCVDGPWPRSRPGLGLSLFKVFLYCTGNACLINNVLDESDNI